MKTKHHKKKHHNKTRKKKYNYIGYKKHPIEYELKNEVEVFGTYLLPKPDVNFPREFSWMNVKNHYYYTGLCGNFTNPVQNQHSPVYCGSCWIINSLDVYATCYNVYKRIHGVV